jgi:hypothetical protein
MEHAKDILSVKRPKQCYHPDRVESVALWLGSVKNDVGPVRMISRYFRPAERFVQFGFSSSLTSPLNIRLAAAMS